MAAAAGSGARRMHQQELQHKLQAGQHQAAQIHKFKTDRANSAFDSLSTDGGVTIPSTSLEEFLSRVQNIPREKLNYDGARLVLDTERGRILDKDFPSRNSYRKEGLHRQALLASWERYDEYMHKLPYIDQAFEKFDVNKDGYLSQGELRRFLQDYERRPENVHNVNGFVVDLVVRPEDVDDVIEKVDRDGDKRIGRHELIPAMEVWEDIAAEKLEKKTSSCCTIS
mmetsp:Transcript_10681/g.16836  ORF Transcript_10681/g.16836 Transcript_10681/m.16836 type:complete len:226 (-) Transcript_10681:152-829(-)